MDQPRLGEFAVALTSRKRRGSIVDTEDGRGKIDAVSVNIHEDTGVVHNVESNVSITPPPRKHRKGLDDYSPACRLPRLVLLAQTPSPSAAPTRWSNYELATTILDKPTNRPFKLDENGNPTQEKVTPQKVYLRTKGDVDEINASMTRLSDSEHMIFLMRVTAEENDVTVPSIRASRKAHLRDAGLHHRSPAGGCHIADVVDAGDPSLIA